MMLSSARPGSILPLKEHEAQTLKSYFNWLRYPISSQYRRRLHTYDCLGFKLFSVKELRHCSKIGLCSDTPSVFNKDLTRHHPTDRIKPLHYSVPYPRSYSLLIILFKTEPTSTIQARHQSNIDYSRSYDFSYLERLTLYPPAHQNEL